VSFRILPDDAELGMGAVGWVSIHSAEHQIPQAQGALEAWSGIAGGRAGRT